MFLHTWPGFWCFMYTISLSDENVTAEALHRFQPNFGSAPGVKFAVYYFLVGWLWEGINLGFENTKHVLSFSTDIKTLSKTGNISKLRKARN